MMDGLTSPERAAAAFDKRNFDAVIFRGGGCTFCAHAVRGWGMAACSTEGRTYPKCNRKPGASFTLSDERAEKVESLCQKRRRLIATHGEKSIELLERAARERV